MIDKSKNVCYVIWVNYWGEKENKREIFKQKFLSQHQFASKRFEAFLKNYFKDVGGFTGFYKDDLGSQSTVSRANWHEVKTEVLEGITEREKCY